MERTWKLVLLLSGIFVAGAVVGGVATLRFKRDSGSRRQPLEQWSAARMKHLVERLDLTPAQVDGIRPIIRRHFDDLGRVRSESLAASRAILEQMEGDIAGILTADQKEKYDRILAERRERERRMIQDGRWSRGDNPRGPQRQRPDRMRDDRGEPAGGRAPDAAPADRPATERPPGGR